MARNHSDDYIYAVSRIRAIEKYLLDETKLQRMLEAKTAQEAIKVLEESGYGAENEVYSAEDYELLLKNEQKQLYSLINELMPQSEISKLFLTANDYHNVKVMLKAEFQGLEDYKDLLYQCSNFELLKLEAIVRDRRLSYLPEIMAHAVQEAIDAFNKSGNPQVIDTILDRAQYKAMKELASQTQSEFVINFIDILLDLTNIKIFLRIKKLGRSWDYLKNILVEAGTLDNDVFIKNLEGSWDNFIEAMRYTKYGKLIEKSLEQYKKTGSFTKFEKLLDNYIMKYVAGAKYISFGIEPIVAYIQAKETEIKNARIIMVGKLNNISNEIIKERLRKSYV